MDIRKKNPNYNKSPFAGRAHVRELSRFGEGERCDLSIQQKILIESQFLFQRCTECHGYISFVFVYSTVEPVSST